MRHVHKGIPISAPGKADRFGQIRHAPEKVQVIIGVTVPDVRAQVCERLGMDY